MADVSYEMISGNGTTMIGTAGAIGNPSATDLSAAWDAWSVSVKSIGGLDEQLEALIIDNLGLTDTFQYTPADLSTIEPFTAVVRWNNNELFPLGNTAKGTLTISFPKSQATVITTANLAGSAFATRRAGAETANNQLIESEIEIQFDGVTGPTYTAETVA